MRKPKLEDVRTGEAKKSTTPAQKRLEDFLAERGLTSRDVPNYRAVNVVSALPGVKLKGAGTGFEINYPDTSGASASFLKGIHRARITDPKPPLDANKEPVRYTQAVGSGSHLYVPARMYEGVRAALTNPASTAPLLIVEGEVKTDKAAKHAPPEMLVVGIAGITAWSKGERQLLDLLARLVSGRKVYVAPDQDHRSNPGVQEGLRGLRAAVRKAGASSVRVLAWDRNKGKGLDDLLTATKKPDAELLGLLKSATAQEELGTLVSLDVATDPPPMRWLLHDAIPAGRAGVFAGPGGMGKTRFLAGLAVYRALGRPFLGRVVLPGPTLLVSAEDGADDYHSALASYARYLKLTKAEIKTVNDSIVLLDLVGTGFKVAAGDYKPTVDDDAVARLVERTAGICTLRGWDPTTLLVVLETYSRMSSGEGNEDASAALAAIERLTREVLGCSAMYVHHQSKAANKSGDSDSTGARGGQALSDNARFLLMLTRPVVDKDEDPEEVKHLAVFTPAKVNRAVPQDGQELVRTSLKFANGEVGWVFVSRNEVRQRGPGGETDIRDAVTRERENRRLLLMAVRDTVLGAANRGETATATKLRTRGNTGLLDTLHRKAKEYGVAAPRKGVDVGALVSEAIERGYLKLGDKCVGGGNRLVAGDVPTEHKTEPVP